MPTVQFWFEFGSTYTYLSVARLRSLAEAEGVAVEWKPFLLMPLLVEQGLENGPFLPFPNKLAYMWRDLERRAAEHGIPYRRPEKYPPDEVLTSARLALLGSAEGWSSTFTEAAFALHWTEGCIIGTEENIHGALMRAGQDPDTALARARSAENKAALKEQTEQARQRGIFGSPTFIAGDELFWGDDRLEQALNWAKAPKHAQ
ncbi:2-hydroxychromene-2-carboxylate isomerase [Aquisalimonas lutea]|uniref:2-hydroxychromene-2-carboxylate isomerase n=1 Tax=Aquisalimonas lutea TaxID=1327750 RepID=UPI0025B569E7|nr:2-hydroxychromene-2-carboxylate isomerase [Aquisalimonas lutea]MDN3519732.1 2-hydroxychromene-2-carboxylate isomerase [Aquisalimonas lutea]